MQTAKKICNCMKKVVRCKKQPSQVIEEENKAEAQPQDSPKNTSREVQIEEMLSPKLPNDGSGSPKRPNGGPYNKTKAEELF